MESCLLQVMQGGWHSWYMMVYVGMFSRDVKCAKSKRCGSSFLEVRCMDLGEDLVHPWFARFCKHNSPPARWGLLDFIRAVLLLLRLLRLLCRLLLRLLTCRLLLAVQIPVGTAGPQPRLPGRSGHCRTSTATSRSQWALPDLNSDFQIAVGTAGPQPRLPNRSGHCRTSTGRMSEKMSDRMSEDMPDRMPERMSEDMPDRMSEDMPERMSEDMPDRMSEDMPDRMSEDMLDMRDRWGGREKWCCSLVSFGQVAYLDISFQSCGVCSYICHGGDHSKWSNFDASKMCMCVCVFFGQTVLESMSKNVAVYSKLWTMNMPDKN